ncbi:MAG: DUF2281 domain-containing protein [Brasilonema angustatum HA4187-MV1]|jgi:hypothetical protein|nr:DUF2281 domain-containing protein [Brasilonema angustatum HA4187-MV1]
MTIKRQLIEEIESTSESLLAETLDFLRFLKTQQEKSSEAISPPHQNESPTSIHSYDSQKTSSEASQLSYTPASGRSILRHAGTWAGDDYQECLELVYASRGKAKFDDNEFE